MCDLVARTGRLQQRYEAGCRLVAGCIPFKYRDSDGDGRNKTLEVLMINSLSGPGLLFPKGGWVMKLLRRQQCEKLLKKLEFEGS